MSFLSGKKKKEQQRGEKFDGELKHNERVDERGK